ncbi:glycosyltransferase family 9 protein [Halomonas urumqiensis]|uniref:Glycosyl transferase n=1 Tax=Halomonas urumqiensis TaxID=1684789 RepID=A0A2N7UK36_9GAMM|nr:glycosyltransferase family 9 protein [Halomonas urumqiensis]PMR80807.1 glycosyl transferase [Halomonas urumqiensis]PTB02764.1 lipopolysaccharide heptosyltransferase family protein [Halomonas urumqiensis]GHE21266.1 glycosyl transferase [Halomonas urumqiensis]
MKHPLPAQPRHIGVLRLSALGDVCNLVPTVRALQRQWPEARITWIIGKGEHSLLAGLTGVEFVVYDKASGLAGMRALWRELADTRFDVLLHMQQAVRASVLSLGLKATVRVGYDKDRAKDRQHWFTHRQLMPHPRAHVLESFLDFARLLGVEDLSLAWDLPVPPSAHREAMALTGDSPYVLISPCANPRLRNFRNWSAEGYATLAGHLWEQHGLKTLLTGGGSTQEREMGARIQALSPAQSTIDAIGASSLKGLLALIQRARVTVAPDSGPVHMANALGTPVVGLYATTNPDRAAPYLWRDYVVNRYPDAVEAFLHQPLESISWGQRVRHPDAMSLIGSEDVIERLEAILAQPHTPPPAPPDMESRAHEA